MIKAYQQTFRQHPNPISVCYPNNLVFPPHWHLHVEIVWVLEGSIQVGIYPTACRLFPGEIAVCTSNQIHDYQGESSRVALAILDPAVLDAPGGWPVNAQLDNPFFKSDGLPASVQSIMPVLFGDKAPSSPAEQMEYKAAALLFFAHILRSTRPLLPGQVHTRLLQLERIQKALAYMEQNFTRPLQLDEVAEAALVSKYYFSRLFKSMMGIPFLTHLNTLRVNHAETLLLHSTQSVTDVAFSCGFENVRTFNRVFLEMKKTQPSQLRLEKNIR